ncbi:MAG: bifunctional heptose 7-phosphate kinase/heptose 1-phosphate adenyltransferase [Acidobacteriota bacterium]
MATRARIHDLVERFAGRRIVVYGDLVLDRFILGSPKRISREAPVVILRFEEQRDVPGGGANALANIAALGGAPLAVGLVGDDEPGGSLAAALRSQGIDTAGIEVVAGMKTTTKVRVLAGGPSSLRFQVARYDVEDHVPDDAGLRERLFARLERAAAAAAGAAISDYGYGTVNAAGVARLRAALPPGSLATADSRYGLGDLGPVDGATPNLEELAEVAGGDVRGDRAVADAAEALRRRLGASFLAATRGSQGMTLVQDGRAPLHLPVYGTDQVADVTGAGDTVLAVLVLSLASGATPREAAALANIAGGIVVTKLGTATVTRPELHRAIDLAEFLDD